MRKSEIKKILNNTFKGYHFSDDKREIHFGLYYKEKVAVQVSIKSNTNPLANDSFIYSKMSVDGRYISRLFFLDDVLSKLEVFNNNDYIDVEQILKDNGYVEFNCNITEEESKALIDNQKKFVLFRSK
jgi:hypothetical protein